MRMRHANTLFFLSPEFFTKLLSLTQLLTVSTKLYTKSIIVLKIHRFPVRFYCFIPSEYLFFSRLSQANVGHLTALPISSYYRPSAVNTTRMCVFIHTVRMWQVTRLLLACVVWFHSWHNKDPPPQHTFFSCSTPVSFSKPCSVITLFSTQSISRQSQVLFFSKSRPSSLVYIALLLFGISWDVELNPGPDTASQETIYPCGICQEPVTWEQNSICCDTCELWCHKDCLSMSTTLFTRLANSDTSWLCPTCDAPNFSSVLFNTPITDSNDERYTILTDSMKSLNLSNISTPTSFSVNLSDVFSSPMGNCSPGTPQATSSPHTNTPTRLRTPVKDNIKLAIVNCNSVVNKIQEFQTFLSVTDPDLVLGTESWLKPEISNSEVFPPEYTIFRRDRKSDTKKSGGGVFILARREYICSEIQVDTDCEFQAVELQLQDQQNVKVCNFYRPPWTDDNYFDDFTNAMQ